MELDCLVIGYNDYPINKLVTKAKAKQHRSADYYELCRNSYLVDNQRLDLAQLLNAEIRKTCHFDPELNVFETPNLGAFYLAAYLKERNFQVDIINLFNKEGAHLDRLLSCEPKTVVITTTYYVSAEPIEEIVSYIRERAPTSKIIIGGPFIFNLCKMYAPIQQDAIFQTLNGDVYIVDPQGEATLARTVKAICDGSERLQSIPNLVFCDDKGQIIHTTRSPEDNRLEQNIIDWNHFDKHKFTPISYMRTSRSCPFSCLFCNYPAMGGKYKVVPVDIVLKEMRQLYEAGTRFLIFTDDTFNVPVRRFKELLKAMIAERLNFQWISFFRCSHVDDECWELMRRSGCLAVYLGIESGDEDVLKAMNKYATAKQYRDGIRKLHDHGILTFGSFIVGYPGETAETVQNTFDFIEETGLTFFNPQMYFHNPIAPVHDHQEKFGIKGSYYQWQHNTMGWEEASEWTSWMLKTVKNSIQLPLYGFSIWSIPYMLTQGFTLEQIKTLAKSAHKIMVKGLDDSGQPCLVEREEMADIFSKWHQTQHRTLESNTVLSL